MIVVMVLYSVLDRILIKKIKTEDKNERSPFRHFEN